MLCGYSKLLRGCGSVRFYGSEAVEGHGKMWKNQKTLPRFPLPKLDETLKRFREAIRPLLTEEEFNKYNNVINDFEKNDGVELQRILENTDKEAPYSWMEGFWQSMYKDLRCPMPINVNPWLVVGDDPNPKRNNSQILKAASMIAAAARFAALVQKGELEPDVIQGVPMCMNGFKYLLGGTRVPVHGRDEFIVSHNSKHVTVLCHNLFFKVDVLTSNGSVVPELDIARQLSAIKEYAKKANIVKY